MIVSYYITVSLLSAEQVEYISLWNQFYAMTYKVCCDKYTWFVTGSTYSVSYLLGIFVQRSKDIIYLHIPYPCDMLCKHSWRVR